MDKITVRNDERNLRFEITDIGERAYMEYRYYKDLIVLMHTFVPPSMRGIGAATQLAISAFDFAEKSGKKVRVYCPFVWEYINKNPEYKRHLDHEYHKNQ